MCDKSLTFQWCEGDELEPWLAEVPPPGGDAAERAELRIGGSSVPAEVLGALCRRFPAEVLVCFDDTAAQAAIDCLRALGFSEAREAADRSASAWVFSLYDYKPPPAWLNAKHWANPERFGLDVGADAEKNVILDDMDEA